MKKVLSLLLVATFIVCAFAACGGSTNYLSWKAEDYNKASDADKLKCVEAYTTASLKAQGEATPSGEELTASAQALQPILEAAFAAKPEMSVQEIIDMTMAAQSAAADDAAADAATDDAATDEAADDAAAE